MIIVNIPVGFAKVTSVDDLKDLNSAHWAYEAVKNLVDKYGIQGYPDDTFKGEDKASRYEMASALDQVSAAIGDKILELGLEKADREDVAMLIKLQQEFSIELAAFKLRAEAIEKKDAEQDAQIAEHNLRIEKIERVEKTRDLLTLYQPDLGKGIPNAMQFAIRAREDTNYIYHEANPNSIWGEGSAFVRLTAAVGRTGPLSNVIPSGSILSLYNIPSTDAATCDDTTRNLGYFTNTRPVAFIEQAWFTQEVKLPIKGGKLNLTAGLVDITNEFDTNLVANDETTQFVNFALTNNLALISNYINPMAIASYNQELIKDKLNLTLKAGAISYDPVNLSGASSIVYEGDLQYYIKNKEGNVRVGGMNGFVRGTDRNYLPYNDDDNNNKGIYVSIDQQLYKNTRVFGRYCVTDSGATSQAFSASRQSYSFGAQFNVGDFLGRRKNDIIGIGYANAVPILNIYNNPDFVPSTSEKMLEAYYNVQVNDNLIIGPDLQFIFAPGGFGGPMITVLGFRSYFKF